MFKYFFVAALFLPLLVSAQNADQNIDLHEAVLNSVVADPRSANMSPEEVQAIVLALETEAAVQNMEASDITPATAQEEVPVTTPDCVGIENLLCSMNSAFGFDGKSDDLPFLLWTLSGIAFMLLAIFELRLMRGQWHWLTHDPRYK